MAIIVKSSSIEDIELKEISKEEIEKNIHNITRYNVAIWRRNIDNALVTIPMPKLKQFLGEKSPEEYIFYIEKDWEYRIKSSSPGVKIIPDKKKQEPEMKIKEMEKYGRVDKQLEQFRKMSVVEREEVLDEGIAKMSKDNENDGEFDISMVMNMVDVVASTFYANNANLEDNLSVDNLKNNIYGVLAKTNWIIQLIIERFATKKYSYSDYKIIDKISTGSSTIDHINKVLLGFITFCLFYNDYIDMGLITKNIRVNFKEKYLKYYQSIFPDEAITIEKIYQGGMRRIDTEEELLNYSIGALLYDIGKIADINYHDGLDNYDVRFTKQHVTNGYNMIVHAKKYSFDILAMAAFHHEYYDGKGSYKFTKPLLSKFMEKKITYDNLKYCITYNKKDFKNGVAFSYFPCKMVEIIDVYDAIVTKKKKSVEDALTIMKIKFLVESLKIDPVLFRIFLDFKLKCGLLGIKKHKEIDSIK